VCRERKKGRERREKEEGESKGVRGSYPLVGGSRRWHASRQEIGQWEELHRAASLLHEEDKNVFAKSPLDFGVFWEF
jgi:hypothetical protein